MKNTFFNLPSVKKNRIIKACIKEFGRFGYEKASTSRIIKSARISKGGLYEYIDSKEELYIYIAEVCFSRLYVYIEEKIIEKQISLPPDILERFQLVAEIAIDFYIAQPEIIAFIAKCNHCTDPQINSQTETIFRAKFNSLFGTVQTDLLEFEHEPVLELLKWLLVKTRNDFLLLQSNRTIEEIKKEYFKEWDFYLRVLRNGIYKTNDTH